VSNSEMSNGVKVYVGNLPDNCKEGPLRDLFSPYGTVKDVLIIKKYAFIHFESESDAEKAVRDLHKTKLLGNELTVEISNRDRDKNQRKPERRRSKNSGFHNANSGYNNANSGFNNAPPGAGGILGMGPGGNLPNAALGLLSAVNAVNTLKNAAAAVAAQNNVDQRPHIDNSYDRPENNMGSSVGNRDRQNPSGSNGYVIFERFYVDTSHPLLKGLPVPELPRVQDVLAKKDPYAQDISILDDPYANNSRKESFSAPRDGSFGGGRRDDPYSNTTRGDEYFAPRRDDSYNSRDRDRDNYDNVRERSPLNQRRDYDRDNRIRSYDDYGRWCYFYYKTSSMWM